MKFGLIGKSLSHSFSREIHALIANYDYSLLEIDESELSAFFERRDFLGINVTIPYKEKAMAYLDEISDEAKKIGAVNTVVNRDGKLFGFNTDFFGMRSLINRAGIDCKNKKVLILGSGGTSKTASEVAKSLGAKDVKRVSRKEGAGDVTYDVAYRVHGDADVIVNTTPVGMYPCADACPVDLSKFKNPSGVVDAIYNPLCTNLVLDAKDRGLRAQGGLYMLVAQAVYASAIFQNKEVDERIIDRVFSEVLKEKRNVVFIGMPSSGKTTIGRIIAKIYKKEFVDTDAVIVEKQKMPISRIFETEGEEGFRRIESEVINELSMKNGLVIATGGGAILNDNNARALRRNGTIVFLDRSLDNLVATADRPLSSDMQKLKNLFEKRYDVYKSRADFTVNANGDIQDVVNEVRRLDLL